MTSTDIYVDLVINRLSKQQYVTLSAAGQTDSSQLYFIDDEDFDVFNKRVVNMDFPTGEHDGVNLGFLSSNYIKQAEIGSYVDSTKLFDPTETSCVMFDGGVYSPRLETDEWTVQKISGEYEPEQVSVFYYGEPGKTGSGFGWAFNCANELTVYTGNTNYSTATAIEGEDDQSRGVKLKASRPIHWDRQDSFVKASWIY